MTIENIWAKIIALIFITFGILNMNDPDGILWVITYFIIGVIPFASKEKISNNKLRIISTVFFIVGVLVGLGILNSLMPIQIDDQMVNMWEHQREGGGLILGSVWIWFSRKLIIVKT